MEAAPFSGDYSFGESSEESLEMRILDPIHNPGWDHVVALHRDAGCFHTSAWAKVLHQTYNHRPFYLRFSRGRRLAALVPLMEVRSPFTGRRGVCLPFSDVCEPLIFDQEMVGLVRDRLLRFTQEWTDDARREVVQQPRKRDRLVGSLALDAVQDDVPDTGTRREVDCGEKQRLESVRLTLFHLADGRERDTFSLRRSCLTHLHERVEHSRAVDHRIARRIG